MYTTLYPKCVVYNKYVLYIQTQCTPSLWSWAQYKNIQIPPGMCMHVCVLFQSYMWGLRPYSAACWSPVRSQGPRGQWKKVDSVTIVVFAVIRVVILWLSMVIRCSYNNLEVFYVITTCITYCVCAHSRTHNSLTIQDSCQFFQEAFAAPFPSPEHLHS